MENYILLLAACLCGCCAVLLFFSTNRERFKPAAALLWCVSAALILCAASLMTYYLVTSRFEYVYVYSNTSRDTALIYKISSLWSGQGGSFLLWSLIQGFMGFFVLRLKGNDGNRSFGIYAVISFCVYAMCFITRPFETTGIAPTDGLGLNEALKDPWMVVHPPLVFISYTAMAVLFALSAILPRGAQSEAAQKQILAWLRISWFFLGAGILAGSLWAYRALGWGGYWSWDPIENAALVPWLVLTGFLHGKEHIGRAVCMVPFPIACFGVFMARSGILKGQSTHAYTDGNPMITALISCFVVGAALYLLSTRIRNARGQSSEARLKSGSRMVSYSLHTYAALIFIGTVAPIVFKLDTPVAFFSGISIVFVLAYSTLLLKWDFRWLNRRHLLMIVVSTFLVIAMMVSSDASKLWWLLLIWVCLMPFSLWIVCGFRTKSWKFCVPHFGMILLIIGAIASSGLGKEVYANAPVEHGYAAIAGLSIPVSEFETTETLIKTLPQVDLIIHCAEIKQLTRGEILIPYATKPLIMLFWIGCFVVTAQPCAVALSKRLRKHDANTRL